MKKILSALVVTATVAVTNLAAPAPAHAHAVALSCPDPVVVAVQVTQNSSTGFVDVATATAVCADVTTTVHTAQLMFEWQYDPLDNGNYVDMPACPTRVVAPEVPWVGGVVVAGVATCERPSSSGAYLQPRRVCVAFLVDGATASRPCPDVLLS